MNTRYSGQFSQLSSYCLCTKVKSCGETINQTVMSVREILHEGFAVPCDSCQGERAGQLIISRNLLTHFEPKGLCDSPWTPYHSFTDYNSFHLSIYSTTLIFSTIKAYPEFEACNHKRQASCLSHHWRSPSWIIEHRLDMG